VCAWVLLCDRYGSLLPVGRDEFNPSRFTVNALDSMKSSKRTNKIRTNERTNKYQRMSRVTASWSLASPSILNSIYRETARQLPSSLLPRYLVACLFACFYFVGYVRIGLPNTQGLLVKQWDQGYGCDVMRCENQCHNGFEHAIGRDRLVRVVSVGQ
jgi:hypothetical protein